MEMRNKDFLVKTFLFFLMSWAVLNVCAWEQWGVVDGCRGDYFLKLFWKFCFEFSCKLV